MFLTFMDIFNPRNYKYIYFYKLEFFYHDFMFQESKDKGEMVN